jgi:hypothetical protein
MSLTAWLLHLGMGYVGAHLSCLEVNKHMVVVVNRMRIRVRVFPPALEVLATNKTAVGVDVRQGH